ncbi:DUF5667 domain-containing protein [Anaerolineales bacterium HSG24]|nr:DUF5667 domain-containing protein [Anaerolineales bacterium HSG24]
MTNANQFETILDECISAIQAGIPIDEVLETVPEYATELRPMLYAATILTEPNPVLVPIEQKANLRAKYMAEVATLPQPSTPPLTERLQAAYHIARRRLTREALLSDLLTIAITTMLTIIMTLLLVNYAAIDAIPGDLLYRFKRMSENIQLTLSWSDENDLALQEKFSQRRLYEVEELLSQDRSGQVEFTGAVENQGKRLWLIEGYPVILPAEMTLDPAIQLGSRVHVMGFLRTNRDLVADEITLVE